MWLRLVNIPSRVDDMLIMKVFIKGRKLVQIYKAEGRINA